MDTEDTAADPECSLILEAIQMHLETIRTRLVSLTEHFQSQIEVPPLERSPVVIPVPPVPSAHASINYIPSSVPSVTNTGLITPPTRLLRRGKMRERSSSADSSLTHTSNYSAHPKCKPLSEQVSDWKPLHNYYKHVHLQVLQEHVQQQLRKQREMDNRWTVRCRGREARERRARLALKPRAPRSELKNDTLFLQKLHTSIFYKIVEVEHKMKKRGLLRSKLDHELFWDTMLSQGSTKRRSPPLPVSSVIEEEPEDLTNTWAITGMHQTRIPAHRSQPHIKSADEVLVELRQAAEANKPPKMHSLSDVILSTQPLFSESSEASKAALVEVRAARDLMQRMTEHSRRNESTAQLFMERPDFVDFSSVFSEFCSRVDNQLDSLPLKTPTQKPHTTPVKKRVSLPPISHPHEQRRYVKPYPPSPKTPPIPAVTEHIPLCMSEVVSCGSVVVRTTKTTLWRNPLVSLTD